MNKTISPRRWWQFGDSWRINRKLRKMKGGSTLYFGTGVYHLKKSIKMPMSVRLIGGKA